MITNPERHIRTIDVEAECLIDMNFNERDIIESIRDNERNLAADEIPQNLLKIAKKLDQNHC